MIIHCGVHKCLTVLTQRVCEVTSQLAPHEPFRFLHFHGMKDEALGFAEAFKNRKRVRYVVGLNNHIVDPSEFQIDDLTITCVTRDPKQLLISGYKYHLSGGEPWCSNPVLWPAAVKRLNFFDTPLFDPSSSLQEQLKRRTLEDGLSRELAIRQEHFHSQKYWTTQDRHYRMTYEEVVRSPARSFEMLFDSWGFGRSTQRIAGLVARYFTSGHVKRKSGHISRAAFPTVADIPEEIAEQLSS